MLRFFTIIVSGLLATQVAMAHSTHSQITEVEWNGDRGRFEVAMRLDIAGLEDSLSVRVGKKVRLGTTQSVEKLLVDYLADSFEIDCRCADGMGYVTWHGLELELHSVWLYFEYTPQLAGRKQSRQLVASQPANGGEITVPTQVRIRNQCVVDVWPTASHFISLKCGHQKLQGHCDLAMPWVQLQTSSPAMWQLQQPVN
jgi:hypothetical protein